MATTDTAPTDTAPVDTPAPVEESAPAAAAPEADLGDAPDRLADQLAAQKKVNRDLERKFKDAIAKVNGKQVGPDYKLQPDDKVVFEKVANQFRLVA